MSEQVAVGLASGAAPMLVALPLLISFDPDAWPLILGLTLVVILIATVLLVGVTPTREREELEVGLIWAFAGAGSALAFTGPADSCLSTSPQADLVIGAIMGIIIWPCFVVLRRGLDHLLQHDAK